MAMNKNSLFYLIVLIFVVSCAHKVSRNPASLLTHHRKQQQIKKSQKKTTSTKKKSTSKKPSSDESPDPKKPQKPKKPKGPKHGEDNRDGDSDESNNHNESARGCSGDNLEGLDMGNGFSAADVLHRVATEGTFSGKTKIPTWRTSPSSYGNASQYYVDYANSIGRDRDTLGAWFEASAPNSEGSDIYDAAKDSPAFKYAVNFVNGNGAVRVYKDQADAGHRIATLLAVMFAAAKSGQEDCVAFIQREWVKQILPDQKLRALFNSFEGVRRQAASDSEEGTLDASFQEVYQNRQRIYSDLSALDQTLAEKEKLNQEELKRIQDHLKQSAQLLKTELSSITPCRDQVSLQLNLRIGVNSSQALAQNLVQECERRLNSRLSDIRHEQSRKTAELKINEERKANAERALREAEEKGRDQEAQRRREAIAQYDIKIETLTQQIDSIGEKAEVYSDYLNLLNNPELSSVTMELDRINELVDEGNQRQSPDYLKAEKQQLNRLKAELSDNSTNYLTLGFMGGFDSTGIASMISAPR